MLLAAYRRIVGLILGSASRAARPKLDADARLAMPPRALDNELHLHATAMPAGAARRVRHLVVYDGGLSAGQGWHRGPLGGPAPHPSGDGVRRARRA